MKRSMLLIIGVILVAIVAISAGVVVYQYYKPSKEPQQVLVIDTYGVSSTFDNRISHEFREELTLVNDPYFTRGPDGKIYPDLVESYSVTEDGLVYTWHLREGVKFHNGEAFDANSVKYSFDVSLVPENINYAMIESVDRVEVVDDYTVKIFLKHIDVLFIEKLSDPRVAYPICESGVEEFGEGWGVDGYYGTGPFILEEFEPYVKVVLGKNEEYNWNPVFLNRSGPPKLDRVILKAVAEPAVRTIHLLSGDCDLVIPVTTDDYDYLQKSDIVSFDIASLYVQNRLVFNLRDPPLNDYKVRRALAQAFNRSLWNVYFHGVTSLAYSIVPKPLMGSLNETPEFIPAYDPEAAKSLLEEAGWEISTDGHRYKNGEMLEVDIVMHRQPFIDLGVILASELEKVGFVCHIKQTEWAAMYPKNMAGEFNIWIVAYTYSNLAQYRMALHSEFIGTSNVDVYGDPEVDALLDEAEVTVDAQERAQIYQQAFDKVLEELWWLPVNNDVDILARGNWLKDVTGPLDMGIGMSTCWMIMDAYIVPEMKP